MPTDPPSAAVPMAPRCRNCGAPAPGAYCPDCGQETKAALPTLREFMREAAGRFVAWDGRLWRTLGALAFRPGFLTREYFAGRRRRYIRPARLFLVASLVVFAALRIGVSFGGMELVTFDDPGPPSAREGATGAAERTRVPVKPGLTVDSDDKGDIELGAVGDAIPGLKERIAHFNALSSRERIAQLTDGALRYGPYAMFVLLPAFALLLKLLYLGGRRKHPARPRLYAQHIVFAAHNHAFLFLAIVLANIFVGVLRTGVIVWMLVYMLWSMRVFYGGSWLGILARASVMSVAYAVLFALVTAGLLIAAIVLR